MVPLASSAALLALLFTQEPATLAPYFATAPEVVDRMLALAQVTKSDVVYDLGSGDGRIPIAAARTYGARGVGIDIAPALIEQSRRNARMAGVQHLVEFRLEDALTADIRDATVVTLYLLSSSNVKLRPRLQEQLRPGARVVSHAFSMGPDWPPDKIDQFRTDAGDSVTLYLWVIRGK